MPPTRTTEGLDAAVRIRAERPEIGILILSSVIETRHVLALLRDAPDGMGYLLKDRVSDLAAFTDAVRRIGEGGSVVDPEVVSTLLGRARPRGPLDDLTRRERDVLELMAEGRSNRAIADRLGPDREDGRRERPGDPQQAWARARRGRSPSGARRADVPARRIGLGRQSRLRIASAAIAM